LLVSEYEFDELGIHNRAIPRVIGVQVFANERQAWALLNLILSVLGVILAAVIAARRMRRKQKKEEGERGRKPYRIIVASIAGVGGAVLFFATQTISGATMVWLDIWSSIHVGLAGIIVIASIKEFKANGSTPDTNIPEESCPHEPSIGIKHNADIGVRGGEKQKAKLSSLTVINNKKSI